MERGSLEKLQYDKRLRLRNGWISKEESDRYLDSLPDVSDKIAVEEEEPEEAEETESPNPSAEAPAGRPADPLAAPVEVETVVETPVNPLSPPPFREI